MAQYQSSTSHFQKLVRVAPPLPDEVSIQKIYQWVDEMPLSRPKKNISRDFSDGVLMAEIVNFYFPRLVDLHNYTSCNSLTKKRYNWKTLNEKVFAKLGFVLCEDDVNSLCKSESGVIERVLNLVQEEMAKKIQEYREKKKMFGDTPRDDTPNIQKPPVRNKRQHEAPRRTPSMNDRPASGTSTVSGVSRNEEENNSSSSKQYYEEQISLLEAKIQKMEQLISIKNAKIESLQNQLRDRR